MEARLKELRLKAKELNENMKLKEGMLQELSEKLGQMNETIFNDQVISQENLDKLIPQMKEKLLKREKTIEQEKHDRQLIYRRIEALQKQQVILLQELPEKKIEEVRPFGITSFDEVSKIAEIISKNNPKVNKKEDEEKIGEKKMDVTVPKVFDGATVNKSLDNSVINVKADKQKSVLAVSEEIEKNLDKIEQQQGANEKQNEPQKTNDQQNGNKNEEEKKEEEDDNDEQDEEVEQQNNQDEDCEDILKRIQQNLGSDDNEEDEVDDPK